MIILAKQGTTPIGDRILQAQCKPMKQLGRSGPEADLRRRIETSLESYTSFLHKPYRVCHLQTW